MILRGLTIATLVALFSSAAYAACDHYAGHVDLEGKVGSKRNLGEASVFLPISCTQDRLLFTDIKFRADDLSNREANIGLGARVQREEGIVGGYVYFDRKRSGETDKYYNQITTGAEFLADTWETRANVYAPLSGSKTIGSGLAASGTPFLQGTGIFIQTGGFQVKETPMYGADVEAGFQLKETDLWLYGAGFTFHGNDVPSITGARVRAKYDLTDKVSLNAEGQYDDERGRQGWLGARLSVPFGTEHGTKSRMTQSPVRDIDIVTQAKTVSSGPQGVHPLLNPESGEEQRIIYVDNTAGPDGDGSLEKPYNTLIDAQNDQRAYDIVYVYAGDKNTTNYENGFHITQNNVSLIGEGSDLTYAGHTLKKAGDKPVLTSSSSTPHSSTIRSAVDNVYIAGFKIEDSHNSAISLQPNGRTMKYITIKDMEIDKSVSVSGVGISLFMQGGTIIDNVSMERVTINDMNSGGINVTMQQDSHIENLNMRDVFVTESTAHGINILVGNNSASTLGNITLNDIDSHENGNGGIIVQTRGSGSEIRSVIANNIFTGRNTDSVQGHGFHLTASTEAIIHDAQINNLTSYENERAGLHVISNLGGQITKAVVNNAKLFNNARDGLNISSSGNLDLTIDRASITGNGDYGLYSRAYAGPGAHDVKITVTNSDITDNVNYGLYFLNQQGTGSTYVTNASGQNRIFNNGLGGVLRDTYVSNTTLVARDNWWGSNNEPMSNGQITLHNSGIIDTGNYLVTDPRP